MIALAVAAALGWGASDFFGGDSTGRDVSVFAVVCISELIGLLAVIPILAARGHPAPHVGALADAAVAGLTVTCELSLIYSALSRGLAFITAPVGALGAALAAVVGVISGDPLGPLVAAGLLCALGGSALSSWSPAQSSGPTPRRTDMLAALCAAVAVCTTLSTLHGAGRADAYWATAVEHTSTALSAGVLALLSARRAHRRRAHAEDRQGRRTIPPRRLAVITLIALCGTAGDLAYASASHGGSLTIVAAVSSLYPVTTIVLGRVLKGQRASVPQLLGVGLAIGGTVLLGVATG